MTVEGPATLCLAVVVSLLAGCGSAEPTSPTETPKATPALSGRTVCPGAVRGVGTNLTGAPADALEWLQGTYENDAGFLAVVFDGTQPVVIVDSNQLAEWRARLAPSGVAVAPSCVDSTLLAAVHAVLPAVRPPGGGVMAGYDALDDVIGVRGVDAETLAAAPEQWSPGMGGTALSAIAAGTLRIDPREVPSLR